MTVAVLMLFAIFDYRQEQYHDGSNGSQLGGPIWRIRWPLRLPLYWSERFSRTFFDRISRLPLFFEQKRGLRLRQAVFCPISLLSIGVFTGNL